MIDGRRVFVTGGTGSFGRWFCRRLLAMHVGSVVVYSRDELKQAQMAADFDDPRMRFVLGCVTDRQSLTQAMEGCDIVVHAAAMKRIDACELHPKECMRVNFDGTRAVAEAALQANVHRALFLSTDKASAPNTTYGASKMAAERMWTRYNVYAARSRTIFSATRYGNVLASRGSVVGVWKRQLAEGTPPTITSLEMTRFWMTLDHAVDLVLLALLRMHGGEVFVPKCQAAPITTLLAAVNGGEMPLKVRETGIRRGEKLHEQLISVDEARDSFDHGDHYRIEPDRSWQDNPTPISIDRKELPAGWSLTSETGTLSATDIRRMMEWM